MEEPVQSQDTSLIKDSVGAVTILPLPPGRDNGQTYVVQLQKDQIYRVPPAENALIIERHQNSPNLRNKEQRCCPCFLLTMSLVLLAIVVIIAITLTILYFIFTPNTKPTFSISNFVVMNHIYKNSPPHYQISLMANNPNNRLGIEYHKDAEVLLLFDKTKVAIGKFPTLDMDPNDSKKVMVELSGTREPLPPPMDKSMNDNKYNAPVELGLEMKFRAKIKAAQLGTWVVKCNVWCTFMVSKMRNTTRVLSQECQTNF
ncbi:hypothetical protein RIF29_08652 [Crotalaria pallida]|uniref:Late embryogenesis abundant protein LEA-2 subgroup domain-containing protein n=1 Tax=Crotalaria pallida TaxID=3830 RepID=A0AAN9IHG0_CROPI